MKNGILAPSSLLLAATLILFACGQAPGGDKSAQLAKLKAQKADLETQIAELEKEIGENGTSVRIKNVGLSELGVRNFRHYIDLQGRVEAEENVAVSAKMPGQLTKVHVRNGDVVRKGQLLAELDDQVMQKSLAELELQLKTAEDIYNRQKGLWDQKVGTEIQFIQARTQKEALEKSLATLRQQMDQTRIYAPISGSVDMVMLKAGQAISPGFPLCNIVNLGDLKVSGKVPESYAAKVRKGDAMVIYFPDLDKEVQARVNYVSKTIDPTTRTFMVEAALPANGDYRANMIAVLKIVDYQNPNALVVPINIIQADESGDFVLLVDKNGEKEGVARKAPVTRGAVYGGMVEITSGLKKGDLFISTGYQEVNNGETITF